MKREELKELGLTDEQLGSVMALHGKTVTGLNTQINALEGGTGPIQGTAY